MSPFRRLFGLAVLGLIVATAVAQVHQFNGSVVNIDGDPVAKENVEIQKGGTYLTSDRGEFTFPASKDVDVNSEVLFHVANWIIIKPCELRNGRTYLPSPERTIDIRALRRKDPRLAKAGAAASQLMGCLVEEAVSRFDLSLNSPNHSELMRRFDGIPRPSLAMWRPLEVNYSPGEHHGISDFNLPRISANVEPSSPDLGRDDLLERKAEEFGISKEELAAAVSAWLASPHEGYDRGLAELYKGQYAIAKDTIRASIAASSGSADESKKYVPLARAEYECGNAAAAQSALQVALKAHPNDSLVQNNLSVISKRPNPPTCLTVTVE